MQNLRKSAEMLQIFQNCCRPTDLNVENVSLRRLLNAAYARHIYPSNAVQFIVGFACLPDDYSISEAVYKSEYPGGS